MPLATLGDTFPARYDTEHQCIVAESKDGHKFNVTAYPVLQTGILSRYLINGNINLRWVEEHESRDGAIRYIVADCTYTDTGNLVSRAERYSGPDLDVAVSTVRSLRPDSQATESEIERRKQAKLQRTLASMPTRQSVTV